MLSSKLLKILSFSLLALLTFLLAIATIVEDKLGVSFARTYIYNASYFIILWGGLVASSLLYLLKKRSYKQKFSFMIHLSLACILLGALVTWLSGQKGLVHLRKGERLTSCISEDDERIDFPFSLELKDFSICYYSGTNTAEDFVSDLTFTFPDGEVLQKSVSMNKIISIKDYRFYQSGYDEDEDGTHLSVSYDPYGVRITYFSYGLLLVSLLLFFFGKGSRFKELLRSPLLKSSLLILLLSLLPIKAVAQNQTSDLKVLPQELAEEFCDLYILYNGRICPLQTLAKDFTLKLYGKSSFQNYSVEQVFTSWIFFYSDWSRVPMIEIKSAYVQELLSLNGDYASFRSFFNRRGYYKLNSYLSDIYRGKKVFDRKGLEKANEKYSIIAMLRMGRLVKLFPYWRKDGQVQWYAPNDDLPKDMSSEQENFISKAIGYLLELVEKGDYPAFSSFCSKIKKYQRKELGDSEQSFVSLIQMEKYYNRMDYTAFLFKFCLVLGLLSFFYFIRCLVRRQKPQQSVRYVLNLILIIIFIYMTAFISLRAYISGHFPISNGYETMQFLAWLSLLASLLLQFRFQILLPFGFLLSGLSLLVASLASSPQITMLMPVLSSPLLSIHVVTIMVSYLLFAFMMFNGLVALYLHFFFKDCEEQVQYLHLISQILLYPALFLLTIGTFIGAVWANLSWGRYWGWDPKEVWALITMLIYSFPLHARSIKAFDRPIFFHAFVVLAFCSVLFTYFGVNYLLGGMHSYAK